MPEALQERESQQQDLLDELTDKAIDDVEDGDHDSFFLGLSMELAGDLLAQRFTKRCGSIPPYLTLTIGDQLIKKYAEGLKAAIGDFSRTPEEAAQLLGQLLEKFVARGLTAIRSTYLRQSIHERERLDGGSRGTSENSLFTHA